MQVKATLTNKNIFPAAEIQIVHAGKNDYAVSVDGNVFYRVAQFGIACSRAYYLADLSARDLQWEIDNRHIVTATAV